MVGALSFSPILKIGPYPTPGTPGLIVVCPIATRLALISEEPPRRRQCLAFDAQSLRFKAISRQHDP
jgi:hypothetical protein